MSEEARPQCIITPSPLNPYGVLRSQDAVLRMSADSRPPDDLARAPAGSRKPRISEGTHS